MIPNLEQATALMEQYIKETPLRTHCQIVSGVMGEFAKQYQPDNVEYWQVAGMIHDIDFELYPDQHCEKCVEILTAHDIDPALIASVVSHGYGLLPAVQVEPTSDLEKVLFAIDELTGLITANALVRPSKSVADMDLKSVKKKFKTLAFAANVNRDCINHGAARLGMPTEQLMEQTLSAMKNFPHPYNV